MRISGTLRPLRLLSLFCPIFAAVVLLGGCAGYHIGPVIPKVMEGVKTVAVPTFDNETLLPRLEVLAADSVIKQIQQDGTYRVADVAEADAVVKGTLFEIRRHSSRSVRGDVLATREYTLQVIIHYVVTKRSTGEKLDSGSVSGMTSFFVSGNDVNQDERQAIPLALEDAAVHLVSRISEGW
jgi:hypothetical protein